MLKQVWKTKLVTEVRNTDVEGVGSLRWVDDKLYRWVRNDDAAKDFAVGDVVFHDSAVTDPVNMFEGIEDCDTEGLGLMAGVVMAPTLVFYAAADSSKRCYGWIQVLGYTPSAQVLHHTGTAYAVGFYLKGSAGAVYAVADAATQPLYLRNVQLLEAMASNVTTTSYKKAYVNCI